MNNEFYFKKSTWALPIEMKLQ